MKENKTPSSAEGRNSFSSSARSNPKESPARERVFNHLEDGEKKARRGEKKKREKKMKVPPDLKASLSPLRVACLAFNTSKRSTERKEDTAWVQT